MSDETARVAEKMSYGSIRRGFADENGSFDGNLTLSQQRDNLISSINQLKEVRRLAYNALGRPNKDNLRRLKENAILPRYINKSVFIRWKRAGDKIHDAHIALSEINKKLGVNDMKKIIDCEFVNYVKETIPENEFDRILAIAKNRANRKIGIEND